VIVPGLGMIVRMDGENAGSETAIEIGRTSLLKALLQVLAVLAGSALLVGVGRLVGFVPRLWLVYPLFFALATLHVIVFRRGSRLILDADGLAVVTGKTVDRYRWEDLIEVGWANGDFPTVGCRPIVRPRGKPFAVPGPNQPKVLGTLPVFGRARSAARLAVQAACERHGVPFSDRGALMLMDGPPGSSFRSDR
jgi:hypothetical protein